MYKLLLTCAIGLLLCNMCIAQQTMERSIDELQVLIKQSKADTNRVLLLTELAMKYVTKPGNYATDMNQAIVATNTAMSLSQKLRYIRGTGKCYLVYSNILREKTDKKQGRNYVLHAIAVFKKNGTPEDLADAILEKAHYLSAFTDERQEQIKLLEEAEVLYGKAGTKERQASVLKTLGDLYYLNAENNKALDLTKKSLRLYLEIDYKKLQAVYDQLGMLMAETGQFNEAIKYGLLALKTAEREKDSSAMLCTIYNRLGTSHYYIEQLDKAVYYYQLAEQIATRNRDTSAIMEISNNIVNVYLRGQRPLEAIAFLKPLEAKYQHTKHYEEAEMYKCLLVSYIRTKEFALAKPYAEQSIERIKNLHKDDERHLWLDANLASYYIGIGEYHKAIALCKNLEQLIRRKNLPYDSKRMHSRLKVVYYTEYIADSALGNFQSALQHFKQFVSLRDSLNTAEDKKERSRILVQYETEKKEKDIELLTRKSQLQQTKLQQATFSRNVTLAAIVAALFFMGLLYNRYKLKQRSNRKLEVQQKEIEEKNASLQHLLTEKEWLLKEIHHRIKNNLQTIMSLLNSQSAYLDNDAALAAIQDSRHRIHAMSLIHQRLYTIDNLSLIDMPEYIRELVGYMSDCFDTAQRIRFVIDITPLKLDVVQAIPLALILNEAITNSLKYAFPDDRNGIISISLQHGANADHYLLIITDDGIGIPEDLHHRSGSLGMSLMKGLSEDLDGSFNIANNNGTVVTISFVHDVNMERNNVVQTAHTVNK